MALSALHTVICEPHELRKVIKKCNSLVPLGSPKMIGMVKRPYFTMRSETTQRLVGIQEYNTQRWARTKRSKLPMLCNQPIRRLKPMRVKHPSMEEAIKMTYGTNIMPTTQQAPFTRAWEHEKEGKGKKTRHE